MKHPVVLFLIGCLTAWTTFARPTLPEGVDVDRVKDAANRAIGELLEGFVQAPGVVAEKGVRRFAVLPVRGDLDGGYLAEQLRNQFTQKGTPAGFELYLTRSGPDWDALLGEIEWGQTSGEGALDPASVQKFGRLQGVQGLIAPKLVSVQRTDDQQLRVRLSLQAFVVETGRLLHGDERSILVPLKGLTKAQQAKETVEQVEATVQAIPARWWIVVGSVLGGFVVVVVLGSAIRKASRPR
jgi:hypothetical protein